MNILIVARKNNPFGVSSFVRDQAESLRRKNHSVEILPVEGSGILAYLRHIIKLNGFLENNRVDIIHAYYVYSGITTIFQNKAPVVMTFIGCDFNRIGQRILAKLTVCLKVKKCIFVNEYMTSRYNNPAKMEVICFGIDFNRFYPMDQNIARKHLGWASDKKYILFASTFDRAEKNARLAFESLAILNDSSVELVEFKTEYKPEEINFLYNASDLLLMTSLREGSPQVIKEAMACNLPIVSTDVGDVNRMIADIDGCHLTSFDPHDVADKIRRAIESAGRLQSRERILSLNLDLDSIAEKIIRVYQKVKS